MAIYYRSGTIWTFTFTLIYVITQNTKMDRNTVEMCSHILNHDLTKINGQYAEKEPREIFSEIVNMHLARGKSRELLSAFRANL